MNKFNVKELAKRVLHSHSEVLSPKLMHPQREWFVVLLIMLAIIVGSAVWSAQTYLRYQDVSVTNNDTTEKPAVIYRASLVEAALAEYAERELLYQQLLQGQETGSVANSTEESPQRDVETETSTSSQTVIDLPDNTATTTESETATTSQATTSEAVVPPTELPSPSVVAPTSTQATFQ